MPLLPERLSNGTTNPAREDGAIVIGILTLTPEGILSVAFTPACLAALNEKQATDIVYCVEDYLHTALRARR